MKKSRGLRMLKVLAGGGFLLQATGCSMADVNEFIQTILLGITAAGSVAILQNI
ncbi:MAG: hypothetical protein ACYTFA_12665 [Planctomycetota bacterium]|jgi:hypothetical protein